VGKPILPVRLISISGIRLRSFLLLSLSAQAFGSGLGSYSHLVVSDSGAASPDGVRVTYLGTNGYQFEFRGHALLVDPYFSRVDLLSVALGSRIQPNASRINVRRFQAHYPNWKFRYRMRYSRRNSRRGRTVFVIRGSNRELISDSTM
jgi:hypothetical protein